VPGFKLPGGVVRFEGFQLDLRSGELCQNGGKIVRLPEQPFQILVMLLKHAHERRNSPMPLAKRHNRGV
jgi:DNA-binding response OmpR family regulator